MSAGRSSSRASTKANWNTGRVRSGAIPIFHQVIERTFNVVQDGGTVYLLIPDDVLDWPPEDQAFLRDALPGIVIETADTWMRRAIGDSAWITENSPSHLVFDVHESISDSMGERGITGDFSTMPNPDRVLSFLPAELDLEVGSGAMDRSGRSRVLVFRWGSGQWILAPSVGMDAILRRMGGSTALLSEDERRGVRETRLRVEALLAGNRNPLVGDSDAVLRMYPEILRAMRQPNLNVLIHGELGSGKSTVLSLIARCGTPVGHVICEDAAVLSCMDVERMVERLCGSTGNLILSAGNGTLAMDGMEHASRGLQRRLMRFFERDQRRYRNHNGSMATAGCRWVAMSSWSPDALLAEGRWSPEFVARFDVQIAVPSLNEHIDDIPLLVQAWTEQHLCEHNRQNPQESIAPGDDLVAAWKGRDWQPAGNLLGLRHEVTAYLDRLLISGSAIPATTGNQGGRPRGRNISDQDLLAIVHRAVEPDSDETLAGVFDAMDAQRDAGRFVRTRGALQARLRRIDRNLLSNPQRRVLWDGLMALPDATEFPR